MAITAANLTGVSGNAANNITTPSFTLTANRLGLLTVGSIDNVTIADPTIGGTLSATWVKVDDIEVGSFMHLWVYRTMVGSDQTGTVDVDFGSEGQFAVGVIVDEFNGVDTGGTNGSAAVVQFNRNSATSGTALSVTLSSFADATNNAVFGAGCSGLVSGVPALSPGTGFAELREEGHNGPSTADITVASEWDTGENTTPDMSSDTDTEWGMIALEIKAAAATGPNVRSMLTLGVGS